MDGEEGIIGTLVPAVGDGLWRKVLAIGFHGSVCAGAFLGIVSCANCYTESRCLLWVPFTTLGSVPTGLNAITKLQKHAKALKREKAHKNRGMWNASRIKFEAYHEMLSHERLGHRSYLHWSDRVWYTLKPIVSLGMWDGVLGKTPSDQRIDEEVAEVIAQANKGSPWRVACHINAAIMVAGLVYTFDLHREALSKCFSG